MSQKLEWDMVFADDERESNPTTFKFLQMAHACSQARKSGQGSATLSGFTAPSKAQPTASRPNEVSEEREGGNVSDVASSNGDES